jgi:benzoyl-CoA reductase/2-hydroxyglutaryl-CoA dehydratase subunit BcrC/BadD/HgdB
MAGEPGWAGPLRDAYLRPAVASDAWRADGGRVTGLLGWSAPRELVAAAGMLPVRLSPRRLARDGAPVDCAATAGLTRELPPGLARVVAALLTGALDWVDALLIGRDSEAHTKLFYVLRELRRSGAAPGLPPVAFFDLLRLPARTSARYNRLRAAELAETLAGWGGQRVTPASLAVAVSESAATAAALRALSALRTAAVPRVAGSDALAAAGAAQVLPGPQFRAQLRPQLAANAESAGPAAAPPLARVFLTGSGQDDLSVYETLEQQGLAVVGEDHEWGDDGSEVPETTPDPVDGVVDRYHYAHGGAARAGLRERVAQTVGRVRRARPDAVLHLVNDHDEAAGWELPAVRDLLAAGGPRVLRVRLRDGDDRAPLREAAARLLQEVHGG